MSNNARKKIIVIVIIITLLISFILITNLPNSPSKNGDNGAPIQHPWIITISSHNNSFYKLKVISIVDDEEIEYWGDIFNVTFLMTNFTNINPGIIGNPEPARSILNEEDNVTNLLSGKVSEIKYNNNYYIDFYDNDNNNLISVDDEFIIDSDIIPIDSIGGIDFYLIYDGEYRDGTPIFEVMERSNFGRYIEYVQLSIEKEVNVYNISISYIDETFFLGKTISNLSNRIYSRSNESTLFWEDMSVLPTNNNIIITFYDKDNNNNLSIHDYFIISDDNIENFVFEIYLKLSGLKIGVVAVD